MKKQEIQGSCEMVFSHRDTAVEVVRATGPVPTLVFLAPGQGFGQALDRNTEPDEMENPAGQKPGRTRTRTRRA